MSEMRDGDLRQDGEMKPENDAKSAGELSQALEAQTGMQTDNGLIEKVESQEKQGGQVAGSPLDMTLQTITNLEKKSLLKKRGKKASSRGGMKTGTAEGEKADTPASSSPGDSAIDRVLKAERDRDDRDEQLPSSRDEARRSGKDLVERRRGPVNGVRFAPRETVLAEGELGRWYESLTDEQRASLKDPSTKVFVVAYATDTGDAKMNDSIANTRLFEVVEALSTELDVRKSTIIPRYLGDKPSSGGEGKDQSTDQRVIIHIEGRGISQDSKTPSSKEPAEWSRVSKPVDGVGFAHGEIVLAEGELERWYASLTEEQKASLKNPSTRVFLIGLASRTGSEKKNREIAKARSSAVREALVAKLDIPFSAIKTGSEGEWPGAGEDGTDRSIDRRVVILIDGTQSDRDFRAEHAKESGKPEDAGRRKREPISADNSLVGAATRDKESSSRVRSDGVAIQGEADDAQRVDEAQSDPLDMTLQTISRLEKQARAAERVADRTSKGDWSSDEDISDLIEIINDIYPIESLEELADSLNDAIDSLEAVLELLTSSEQDQPSPDAQMDREISAEEKRERRRVAKPKDGVGFAFGKDEPAKGELSRWYSGISDEEMIALQDPKKFVKIMATASRAGDEDSNILLSKRRAEKLKDALANELGVPRSSIIIYYIGEESAQFAGIKDGKDRAIDRVARIEIETRETIASETRSQDRINETKRTTIPKKFTRDYKHSREWATGTLSQVWDYLKQLVPLSKPSVRSGATKLVVENVRQISDARRYQKEMEQAKDVHEKLWKVRPMRGFLFDKSSTSFRWRVEMLLSEGGYDVKKMYPEYIIHWRRKGAI
jgi:outer membrane protein OmpA-like peptidoglycan-associated protein